MLLHSRSFLADLPPRKRFLLLCGVIASLCILTIVLLMNSASARLFALRTVLSVAGSNPPTDSNGHTNVLLLGVGGEHHDGGDLTDTMILASIDPVTTQSVVLLSIPRDLFLDVNRRMVSGRINAVYANEKYRLQIREKMSEQEASQTALKEVGEEMAGKLGVPIHGVIKVDFTAFETVVDALGGIDIDVPKRIVDYSYPIGYGRVGTFSVDAGLNHFDGETALKYARSRHSTSDFDRSIRQQQLLKAIAAKLQSFSRIGQLRFASNIFADISLHMETTFPPQTLLGLAQLATSLSQDRIISMNINFNAGSDNIQAAAGGFVYIAPPEMFEGASILLPIPLPGKQPDWSQIQTFATFLLTQRALYLQNPKILVQAPSYSIQAHRLHNELLRYGFDAERQAVAGTAAEDSQIMYTEKEYQEAAEFLGSVLELPVNYVKQEKLEGVVVMVGKEYKFEPFAVIVEEREDEEDVED